jgi:hypothetical protein
MPFSPCYLMTSGVPHLCSRMDPETKAFYRSKYRTIKKTAIAGSMVTVGTLDGIQLAKDILSSKLQAYGYKSFFCLISGPVLKFIAFPLSALSWGRSAKRYATAIVEIGDKITAGEMGIVNWGWVTCDILLFGEVISLKEPENSTFLLLPSERVHAIPDVIIRTAPVQKIIDGYRILGDLRNVEFTGE